MLSFVIPAKDEEQTLEELYQGISNQCMGLVMDYEVIFIDDGSVDETWEKMLSLAQQEPEKVRAIKLRTNVGKASALAAGFNAVTGDIVFTMDADLQDDPNEIPRFIEKLNEGFDIVSGYKKVRHDPWHKVFPSRIFNKMVSSLSGVSLRDHNCGFKCYRREVVEIMRAKLYGDMHRMIPSIAGIDGYRSTELVVLHHPRLFGRSKYGFSRYLHGLMDMLTVYLLKNYRQRPMHFVGGLSIFCMVVGTVFIVAAGIGFINVYISQLLVTAGIGLTVIILPLFCIGFLSELHISNQRLGRKGDPNPNIPVAFDSRAMDQLTPHGVKVSLINTPTSQQEEKKERVVA